MVLNDYEFHYKIKATDPSSIGNWLSYSSEIELISLNTNENWAIISIKEKSDSIEQAIQKTIVKLNRFLDLCSLFTVEDMYVEGFFQGPIEGFKDGIKTELPTITTYTKNINSEKFKELITEFFPVVSEKRNEYLRTALNFFRNARIHLRDENDVIEGILVLEALYSKNEEKSEMKYRLANRIATLLAKDYQDRKTMLKQLRDLYDLRSTIVHGSSAENIDKKSIMPWTRESLLRFLTLSKKYSHAEIIDKIDEGMLENSIRDELRVESATLVNQAINDNTSLISNLFTYSRIPE